ncbi:MAG: hypothetical protein CMG26_02975 [Candidatus Marinimicrobia bacterium]|nr:hypothetical protein [Candidatus Neomarinimicrobiota bacterium]
MAKKSKGRKRTESVRARQQRLLKQQRAIVRQGSSKPTSQRVQRVNVRVEPQGQLPAGRQGQLPAGRQGGALTTNTRTRRTNINRTQSRTGTQQASRTNSTRTGQRQLPPATRDTPRDSRRDGRTQSTRQDQARAKLNKAAQGSRSSTVRTPPARGGAFSRIGGGGGLLKGGAAAIGANFLADQLIAPATNTIAYESAAYLRRMLGMGSPTKDMYGNPLQEPVIPGVNAPGIQQGFSGLPGGNPNFAGPGGDPSGSGRNQAQQRVGLIGVDGKPFNPYQTTQTSTQPTQPTTTRQPAATTRQPARTQRVRTPQAGAGKAQPTQSEKDSNLAKWAKSNRKMIEKVGTKTQKALLKKALGQAPQSKSKSSYTPASSNGAPGAMGAAQRQLDRQKPKKGAALAIGGYA